VSRKIFVIICFSVFVMIKVYKIKYINYESNGLWYGVVRDYEAITYQFTPTVFYKPQTFENF